ncbi:agmatinase [Candidatus Woesearchaeota archaeon CG10_big_fil_rev_8_21_14_0_10_44_13]|nr:MAG: agmatinase [Candidatus Woesearchaeota archaeon CG10_big_fil_rev_8_21_14_0_10_44_13]
MRYPDNFLGMEEDWAKPYDKSKVVILPAPYEGTVSYGSGTAKGPSAILEASKQVELYDEELGREFYEIGIWTEDELKAEKTPEKMVDSVYDAAKKHVNAGKFLVMLGGEHSIPTGTVKAYKERYPKLSVLHFDAHADLREEYHDTKYSHAAVMSRVREICPAVQVGIRSLSKDEADKAKNNKYDIFWAKDIHDNEKWFDKAISKLSDDVYITFDIDVFDPSIMSSTGTPEPGGLSWYLVLDFLKEVFRKKNVVGFDLVELAPIEGRHDCDFLAARLVHKVIGYKFFGKK